MNKLISLKLSNFRSFNREQVLQFENKANSNIMAIYGPNASGKSNTAKALSFISWFVQNSANAGIVDIPFEKFLLKAQNNSPTRFELVFLHGGRTFRYEFAFTNSEIVSEKLTELSSQKEKVIFVREYQTIVNASTAQRSGFRDSLMVKTRQNTLLITKAREDNNEYANEVFDFLSNLNIITCGTPELRNISVELLNRDPSMKDEVLGFLRSADLWIRGINIEDVHVSDELLKGLPITEDMKKQLKMRRGFAINTTHSIRDNTNEITGFTQFSLSSQESAGTNVMFDLAALIIDTLRRDAVLYIDEFGLHLHPDICGYIVTQFRKHPKSQLIMNTHDIILMDDLKREEIVFIDKNQGEESIIIPFMSLSPRENEAFSKRYRQGLYGAKPVITKEEV